MRPPAVPQELDHRDDDRQADARDRRRTPRRRRSRRSTARTPSAGCGRCAAGRRTRTGRCAEAITTAASAALGRCCSRLGAPQQQRRHGQRADHAGQLRLRAGGFGDRRARGAAADRKALEEAGREVGRAQADHLLVGVDAACPARGVDCATARWCRRRTPAPPPAPPISTGPRSATPIERQREAGQALRQRAEHRDAVRPPGRAAPTTTVAPDHRDQDARARACSA